VAVPNKAAYDLLIIGGGINGAGIARDAAGRGLRVMLVEQDDLASATSQASSKLIHGGLRYLEHYEFKLVREALREREVLLRLCPQLVRPLNFVVPHDANQRPRWMIRIGLWLYDHLGGRETLPGSKALTFPHMEFSAGLKSDFRKGFVYSDCRVDDARLVVINAIAAKEKGAQILTRTRFLGAKRDGNAWNAEIEDLATGMHRTIRATGIVNVAGPWVQQVLGTIPDNKVAGSVRLVKGSHIVVPKVHSQGHAYLFQNDDKRVIFVIPFEGKYSLIGTTDIPVSAVEDGEKATSQEIEYLVAAANRFLAKPIAASDVVWSYSGVRPLYDDGSPNPSAVSRDYVTKVEDVGGEAPLLTLFGGKITTYRTLAETVLEQLQPYYAWLGGPWTANEPLPGGDVARFNAFRDEMHRKYAGLPRDLVEGITRRHGSRTVRVLGDAIGPDDLGRHFGAGLTEREVDYFLAEEWARTADDILWRRTKCGLHMTAAEREGVDAYLRGRSNTVAA
jgi:glycerol-3-phosphate dehydrogenase